MQTFPRLTNILCRRSIVDRTGKFCWNKKGMKLMLGPEQRALLLCHFVLYSFLIASRDGVEESSVECGAGKEEQRDSLFLKQNFYLEGRGELFRRKRQRINIWLNAHCLLLKALLCSVRWLHQYLLYT